MQPVTNLDDVPDSQMGQGKPYFDAQPVATFLTTQWNTIKANISSNANQVCVGGFIFDWCDEYWKGNNINVQVGGPNIDFQGNAFAGGYWDEAGFGVTSSVNQSTYGPSNPNITRTLFKGYYAVKDFYTASSWTARELYGSLGAGLPGAKQEIRQDIHEVQAKLHHLKQQNENGSQKTPRVRRLLQMQIAVLEARLLFPFDPVLQQMDDILDHRTGLGRVAMRTMLAQLNARLVELQAGG
jgi:hypothetical protein